MDENGIGKEIVNKDSFAILAAWREKENSNKRMLRTGSLAPAATSLKQCIFHHLTTLYPVFYHPFLT